MTNPTEGTMPPLPEPDHKFVDMEDEDPDILVWRAEKMHAYAQAYAAPLLARVAELQEALNDLVERVDLNGGLGEYKSGPTFALKNARAALAANKEQQP